VNVVEATLAKQADHSLCGSVNIGATSKNILKKKAQRAYEEGLRVHTYIHLHFRIFICAICTEYET
jgi:hypothetical protein